MDSRKKKFSKIFTFLHISFYLYRTIHCICVCVCVSVYVYKNEFSCLSLRFPRRRWGPTTTTLPGWYDIMMRIMLPQDQFGVPAVQDGSNLFSWNGAHFYNVLVRPGNRKLRKTLPNTQRLFTILADDNLWT